MVASPPTIDLMLFFPTIHEGSDVSLQNLWYEVSLKMCLFLLVARKSDQWFAVDPATGVKLHSFTPDGVLGTCPILTSPTGALYIGRSGEKIPVLHTVCGGLIMHLCYTCV